MGTPGSFIIRPSGAIGVLASGAIGVKNAQGECPVCCGGGQGGRCYFAKGGTCGALVDGSLRSTHSINMVTDASWTDTPDTVGNNYAYTGNVTSAVVGGLACSCQSQGSAQVTSQAQPSGDPNLIEVSVGVPSSIPQLPRSLWVPWQSMAGTQGVDSFYSVRIYHASDNTHFDTNVNLNTGAIQNSVAINGELSLGRLRQVINEFGGLTNINGQASMTVGLSWQGCVPTIAIQCQSSWGYDDPANHVTYRRAMSVSAVLSVAGFVS